LLEAHRGRSFVAALLRMTGERGGPPTILDPGGRVKEPWVSLIGSAAMASVEKQRDGLLRHPLARIAIPSQHEEAVSCTTRSALEVVLPQAPGWWIATVKDRLTKSDFADAAGALAEIRAYGALARSGLGVQPVAPRKGEPTPDFEVSRRSARVCVEVQTRLLSEAERAALTHAAARTATPPGGGATTAHVVTPFGKPRRPAPGKPALENVTANVIQKIAQAKLQSNQLRGSSVLWLDFQEDLVSFVLRRQSTAPVSTWNGRWWSGALWYAAYGWKGAPIFEGASLRPWMGFNMVSMQHEGRFEQPDPPSLIVGSFEGGLVALENPKARPQLPIWFSARLTRFPDFAIEDSWLSWPAFNLVERLVAQKKTLARLVRRLR
jgi:hypothetical protein